jgi:hypothetical protein
VAGEACEHKAAPRRKDASRRAGAEAEHALEQVGDELVVVVVDHDFFLVVFVVVVIVLVIKAAGLIGGLQARVGVLDALEALVRVRMLGLVGMLREQQATVRLARVIEAGVGRELKNRASLGCAHFARGEAREEGASRRRPLARGAM